MTFAIEDDGLGSMKVVETKDGFGRFHTAAEAAAEVIKVNPAYTSQTCPECGSVNRANRENQAKFACIDCGHEDNADVNAAKNILWGGTRPDGSTVESPRAA